MFLHVLALLADEYGVELSVRDTRFSRRRRKQSGQGVIEYILLLMVTIMIVFGVVYQFNDAFKVWANNYFGDYLTCLLETGELPAIGGTGGVASSCNDMFKTFSLTEGRPYEGGGGSGGGGTGPGGSGGGPGAGDDPPGEGGDSGGAAESGTASGYTKVSRGSGSGFGRDGRFGRNANAGGGGGAGARRKEVYTGSTDSSIPASALNNSGGRANQRQRGLNGEYFVTQEKKEEIRTERAPMKITESSRTERKQVMIIKRKPAEAKEEVEEKEMGFGDYFRYLLIAALIIALVIVIGGQLAQISNEME